MKNDSGVYSLAVSDFGLATNSEFSTEFGCGSVRYESPECLFPTTTHYQTLSADIWSLGIILINMITGKNPWCEPSMNDEMYREYLSSPDFLERHFTRDPDLLDLLKGTALSWDIMLTLCARMSSNRLEISLEH